MLEINKNKQSCSVIILAAGKSSRMESPKFALQFDEKTTFLEEIIKQYKSFGCNEIIVVLNKDGVLLVDEKIIEIDKDVIVVTNKHLEWERFYSIKLGAKNIQFDNPVFIHNVDNPFVNVAVLKALQENLYDAEFVVPVFKGRGGHPILLSKKVIAAISVEKNNDLILSEFLKLYDKRRLDVNDEKVLININTEDAYREFLN